MCVLCLTSMCLPTVHHSDPQPVCLYVKHCGMKCSHKFFLLHCVFKFILLLCFYSIILIFHYYYSSPQIFQALAICISYSHANKAILIELRERENKIL